MKCGLTEGCRPKCKRTDTIRRIMARDSIFEEVAADSREGLISREPERNGKREFEGHHAQRRREPPAVKYTHPCLRFILQTPLIKRVHTKLVQVQDGVVGASP